VKVFTLTGLLFVFSCQQKAPPIILFDGQSLDNWEVRNGKAPYVIEDSMIVGTAILDSPNTFLCTKERYGDFILELDLLCESPLNSGVQIRSNSLPDYHDGAVHGYQVEVDPSDRAFSGGIYDEYRRGWIYPLTRNEAGRKAYKKDDWNHYRIEAIGSDIRVWVNEVMTTNLKDDLTAEGFIGLQVHAIYDSTMIGKTVRWKDITIRTKDLEKHRKPIPVNVYQVNLTPEWSIIEEEWRYLSTDPLFVELDSAQQSIELVDAKTYFDLKFQFKMKEGSEGGIHFGSIDSSFVYQLIDNQNLVEGEQKGAQSLASLKGKHASENLSVPGRHRDFRGFEYWNTGQIIYDEQHIEFWMNEYKMVDYPVEKGQKAPISLECLKGQIELKGMKIKEL